MGLKIAIGADHAGFEMKDEIRGWLSEAGHSVVDLGTNSSDAVDYPDYAALVGRAIVNGQCDRGIIVCGSGAGACVAANKIRGVRAAQATDTYTARQMVEHDDVNVLCLGARTTGIEVVREIVRAFVAASFSNEERHSRRLSKVKDLELQGN